MASDSWNGTLLQLPDVVFSGEWTNVLPTLQVFSVGTSLPSGQGDHGTPSFSLSIPPPPSPKNPLTLSLPPCSYTFPPLSFLLSHSLSPYTYPKPSLTHTHSLSLPLLLYLFSPSVFSPLSLTFSLHTTFILHFVLPQTGYLSGSTPFDEVQLESAISGVIYEIIEREKTVSDAASNALMCYLKQVDNSHNRWARGREKVRYLQLLNSRPLEHIIRFLLCLTTYMYMTL